MQFLFSNHPPLKTRSKTFSDVFYECFTKATSLDIAVGYVTADSLTDLQKILEVNTARRVNLIIGMHYYERFTVLEYQAALLLHKYLAEKDLGGVRLVTAFKYHGKLYTYSNDQGVFAGIIGSNNLSSIVDSNSRVYEASLLIDDTTMVRNLQHFIQDLSDTSCTPIDQIEITEFKKHNQLLENHDDVEKISTAMLAECMAARTDIEFDIPIKSGAGHARSNLNAFHGKGREGKNGLVKPRHWYEVELIVGKEITSHPNYPKAKTADAVFDVITDDGWKFKCKVSGDYSKNFRSEHNLKILGKWLKGRLENAGALKIGELVSDDTLQKYGRSTFTLTKTTLPNLWCLDFGVRK